MLKKLLQLSSVLFILLSAQVSHAALEDFSIYTENDPNSDITVATNTITVDTMIRNVDAQVYFDHGTSYFGEFEHIFSFNWSDSSNSFPIVGVWGLFLDSTHITWQEAQDNTEGIMLGLYDATTESLVFRRFEVSEQTDTVSVSHSTDYYVEVERTATTYTARVFSDEARTTQITGSPMTVPYDGTPYRYLSPVFSYNSSTSPYQNEYISATISDLDIQANGRLWSSGFELQSVTSGMEWDSITAAEISIDTTTKRSGAASIKTAPTAFPSLIKQAVRPSSTAAIYTRIYFRFDGLPATAETSLFSFLDSSTERIGVDLQTDGTLDVDVPGESTVTGTTVLSAGTWYHLELKADPANTSWELRIAEDGSALATESSGTLGTSAIDSVQVSNDNTTDDIDIWFDDIAVNDSRGTYQNSWPGNGRIVHLHPNATGDNDSGVESPTSGPWQVIDEITPDDATTEYELRTTGNIIDVNIEAGSTIGMDESAGDTITLVSVGTRVKGDNATPGEYFVRLKSQASGTLAQSPLMGLASSSYVTFSDDSPRIYPLTSYVDPQAGGAWTQSLIDNTQIGMAIGSDDIPDIWTTKMWLLVEYANPAPSAESTFRPIMFMY